MSEYQWTSVDKIAKLIAERDEAQASSEAWRLKYVGTLGSLLAFLRAQPRGAMVTLSIKQIESELAIAKGGDS